MNPYKITNPQPNIPPVRNQYQKIIPQSIGSIVRGFKIGVTKWFRKNTDIHTIWQRNYYEHIIRNDRELYEIRQYIEYNPLNWYEKEHNMYLFNLEAGVHLTKPLGF